MQRIYRLLTLWVVGILASCGGGSGGQSVGSPTIGSPTGQLPQPSSQPITGTTVLANVYAYPDGYPLTGTFFSGPSSGANSTAWVYVGDYATSRANTGATVVVNGTSLPYDNSRGAYFGSLTIASGAQIDVSVTVGSNAYTASSNQFATLHAFTSPPMSSVTTTATALSVTWTNPTPAMAGGTAFNVWAADAATGAWAWSQSQPAEVDGNSFVVPAGTLSVGDRLIGLLAAACSPIAGAVGSSALCVGAVRTTLVSVSQ
jgi:hypothetical protein